jgi:ABC-type polysaccharide/polyol phosphate export permease
MLLILVPISLALRGTLKPALVLLPVLVVLLLAFVLGCALIVSVLHAYFRDVAPILGAALLPWFFLTPIFFEPGNFGFVKHHVWVKTLIEWVNPIAPFVQAFRSILYDGRAPTTAQLVYVFAAALVALGLGSLVFRSMEGELAVVV